MHLRPGQEDLHIHLARRLAVNCLEISSKLGKLLLTCKVILTEPISHSYKKFKVEVEKVVGEVQIGDGHKVSTSTAVISGLVGSQRTAQSLRKKLEGDNSPVPTRSKSLRVRGDSSNCQGVAQGNKGKRRSFAVMHNSLDSSI